MSGSLLVLLFIVILLIISILELPYLHMFQLNSYDTKEHLDWFSREGNFVKTVFKVRQVKKAKKPLVWTSRVKRLEATIEILLILSLLLSFLVSSWFVIFLAVVFFFAPIFANWINYPIESYIRNWYIKDAKRILKASPDLLVIGITGSYGKTGVKNYLTKLLNSKYNVLMTPASYNTPMGIVKTIRNDLRSYHEIFVCEMGAKKVGEIKELCDIVNPTIGIITAIAEQHLETFGSLNNILKTKFELADAVRGKGPVFLNFDNSHIQEKIPTLNQTFVKYGTKEGADVLGAKIGANSLGTKFDIIFSDYFNSLNKNNLNSLKKSANLEKLSTPLLGVHNVTNLAGAIAVAKYLGVEDADIRYELRKIKSVEHRLSLKKVGETLILDDAFNSNPDGSKAAIDTLGLFFDRLKILVTPGMVELGAKEDYYNQEFGKYAAGICDVVILVGDLQTKSIQQGLADSKFTGDMIITDTVVEALARAHSYETTKKRAILIENDLPDNYSGGKA
ncbi:MAG: UDP-N-acetylmuramoyl-tripeptide--D-alanyl-D-alanine ligase [Candidatus Ancillula sp.]|nr:UDP-N-acetylmuramoyl-tripeptide--D-alanyl-D-alanine ligase [Candidatus Ancillula sp.]